MVSDSCETSSSSSSSALCSFVSSPLADLQLTRSPSLQELMGHDLYTPTAWSQQSVPSQAGSMADGDIAMEQLKPWHHCLNAVVGREVLLFVSSYRLRTSSQEMGGVVWRIDQASLKRA